jgi:hypothetical protein
MSTRFSLDSDSKLIGQNQMEYNKIKRNIKIPIFLGTELKFSMSIDYNP